MALCVQVSQGPDGLVLQPTGQPLESCVGYVLQTPGEAALAASFYQAFASPTPEQVAAWYAGTFSAVLFFFLVARMAGSVAGMFGSSR